MHTKEQTLCSSQLHHLFCHVLVNLVATGDEQRAPDQKAPRVLSLTLWQNCPQCHVGLMPAHEPRGNHCFMTGVDERAPE
jgi:hypothetical protein